MQASAPLPGASTRQLLVLLCTHPSCCTRAHAFSALRVQLPEPTQAAAICAVAIAATGVIDAAAPASNGRIVKGDNATARGAKRKGDDATSQRVQACAPAFAAPGGTVSGDGAGALDFGDLLAEIETIAAVTDATGRNTGLSGASAKGAPRAAAAADAHAATARCRGNDGAGDLPSAFARGHDVQLAAQLPEFWLDGKTESAQRSTKATAAAVDPAHVQTLLQLYARDEGAASSDSSGDVGAAGEQYEKSDALDKYHERLAWHPNQCVRCALLHR